MSRKINQACEDELTYITSSKGRIRINKSHAALIILAASHVTGGDDNQEKLSGKHDGDVPFWVITFVRLALYFV